MATVTEKKCDVCDGRKGVDTLLIGFWTIPTKDGRNPAHAEFLAQVSGDDGHDRPPDLCETCRDRLKRFMCRGVVSAPEWRETIRLLKTTEAAK